MNELEDLIHMTVADLLFNVDVKVVDVEFAIDRPCLALIELVYENEIVSSGVHTAPFCAALCNYNAAIFVDAVRETISKALMRGK